VAASARASTGVVIAAGLAEFGRSTSRPRCCRPVADTVRWVGVHQKKAGPMLCYCRHPPKKENIRARPRDFRPAPFPSCWTPTTALRVLPPRSAKRAPLPSKSDQSAAASLVRRVHSSIPPVSAAATALGD
jgi:hypothetical protein